MTTTPEFIVYTDGASRKDGRGGWGYAAFWDECWWEDCGGEHDTTNNRMELLAVINALEMVKHACIDDPGRPTIQLWSDSMYVIAGITDHIHQWKFRLWRTSANKPIKNIDLWKRLYLLTHKIAIDWQWVKGHTGNEGNERADVLAGRGIELLESKS